MADEEVVQDEEQNQEEVEPEGEGSPKKKFRLKFSLPSFKFDIKTAGLIAALCFCALLVGVNIAGISLRDKVENRIMVLKAPPSDESFAGLGKAGGSKFTSTKAGVKKVKVGYPAPTKRKPPKKAEKRAAPAAEPQAKAVEVKPAPEPKVKEKPKAVSKPKPAPKPKPKKAPAPVAKAAPEKQKTVKPVVKKQPFPPGSHVLQVGVFRSQKYLRGMERRLAKLGFRHKRVESRMPGESFRLAIAVSGESSLKVAMRLMASARYSFHRITGGLEAFFHLEEEAQAAMNMLADKGFKGGYGKIEGSVPVWSLMVGPLEKGDVEGARKRLKDNGIETFPKVIE